MSARNNRVVRRRRNGRLERVRPQSAKNAKPHIVHVRHGGKSALFFSGPRRDRRSRDYKRERKEVRQNIAALGREPLPAERAYFETSAMLKTMANWAVAHMEKEGRLDSGTAETILKCHREHQAFIESGIFDQMKPDGAVADRLWREEIRRMSSEACLALAWHYHGVALTPEEVEQLLRRVRQIRNQPEPLLALPAPTEEVSVTEITSPDDPGSPGPTPDEVERVYNHPKADLAEEQQPQQPRSKPKINREPLNHQPEVGEAGSGSHIWRPPDLPQHDPEVSEWLRDPASPWRIFRR